jgi:hypothetical protein
MMYKIIKYYKIQSNTNNNQNINNTISFKQNKRTRKSQTSIDIQYNILLK